MKSRTFTMRISEESKRKIDRLKKYFNISASAVIDMLIEKAIREIEKE